MQSRWKWAAAFIALLAVHAQAQESPAYRCDSKRGVTYTDIPCLGAREVGATKSRTTNRHAVPPQDRAKLARRAQLTPESRQECETLDVQIRELDSIVKAKGNTVTADDERPLVQSRLKAREMRCL